MTPAATGSGMTWRQRGAERWSLKGFCQPMTEDLLSLREAAELLSRSYGSVRVSRHRGDFPEPTLMIGTVPAFSRADIEAWRDRKRWAPKDHAEKVKSAKTGAAIARASDELSVDIGQSAVSQPARASPASCSGTLVQPGRWFAWMGLYGRLRPCLVHRPRGSSSLARGR